ncbi:hypothetical protein ACVGVM_29400 (plasmid) [Pseudonocardia bannensis]|nr:MULTISPECIES: hypothetical protein [Pseudonocardia]
MPGPGPCALNGELSVPEASAQAMSRPDVPALTAKLQGQLLLVR